MNRRPVLTNEPKQKSMHADDIRNYHVTTTKISKELSQTKGEQVQDVKTIPWPILDILL
jgi:hypothetical protein